MTKRKKFRNFLFAIFSSAYLANFDLYSCKKNTEDDENKRIKFARRQNG